MMKPVKKDHVAFVQNQEKRIDQFEEFRINEQRHPEPVCV
jgi:hypothetical protein